MIAKEKKGFKGFESPVPMVLLRLGYYYGLGVKHNHVLSKDGDGRLASALVGKNRKKTDFQQFLSAFSGSDKS